MLLELTRKMEFTKDSMLPFLLSQIEAVRTREGRTFQFTVDAADVRKANPDRIWVNLRSHPALEEVAQPDVLEVASQDGMVLQVRGIQDITRYCRTETVASVPHKWVQRTLVSKQPLPDEMSFPVHASILEERELQLEEYPSTWEDVPKYYTLHKRFVYQKEGVSIIWNHVRVAKNAYQNMYESDVTRAPIEYELSVEVTGGETELMDALILLCQIVDGTPYPLVKQKQEEVADGYQHIIEQIISRPKYTKKDASKYHFFAPKPVTLEKMNVVDPLAGYGVISILAGYTVTEKADGERILLYVHSDGRVYTINNSMDIRLTGLKVTSERLHGTILDGELVTFDKRHDKSPKDLFLAFDLYVLGGESVINLPLISTDGKPSRFGKMKAVIDEKDLWVSISRDDEPFLELRVKNHIYAEGDEMFGACREILSDGGSFDYDIDGLVFTPAHLSVFGYYPGKPVQPTENSRWDRVFKWKPAEQNTIDFLVERDAKPYVDPITKRTYAVFKLFTGYNANQWEAISVMNGLRLRYDNKYYKEMASKKGVYKTRLFQPITQYVRGVEYAYIPIEGGEPVAENGDIIRDRSIVEFAYDPTTPGPVSKRWIAHRVREDKTRIFQKTGELSKTANDLTVAMSIWRTIHAPVTKEIIMGVAPVMGADVPDDLEARLLGVDDTYYAREVPRAHMLSVHMLNFHNQGIKKMLYERSRERGSLLELACGMAGDLPRWRDSAYKFVLGVDLVRDNITHPREGSYARTVRQKYALTMMVDGVETLVYPPNTVFVIGDCALPLHDGTAARDLDEESKKVLQMVFRKNAAPLAPFMKHVAGRGANGFNVVSCQFAIHYFFQTPEKLHGFLGNVARNLVKGGIFIATFMDGDRVNSLVSNSSNGVVEGRKLDGTVPVWAIIKKYDDFVYKQAGEDTVEPFGKMVDVFLENTNRLIPEFLVSLDLLVTYASSHGLVLDDTQLFSETFAKLRAEVPENPMTRTELDQNILTLDEDEVQKQFSFLNRWVVFRKVN